ncbi:unnamed protein product [Spirodela intermedia]|uniref:Uncharacterized protein n=1 Tax=Spirodela intermedia TaxID=51605 RepID=A0A7I8KAY7_SPIIN|nr:unnamed protein product [Spirodela intermedia]
MTMAVPLSTFPTPLIPNTFHISRQRDLADEHLGPAFEEELAAAGAVGVVDGDEGGEDVDEAGDDGGDEGGVVAEADGLEEDGGVEHDDVDAGELLEEGDEDGHGELGAVLPLHDVGPRVLYRSGLDARHHQVLVLRVDIGGTADLAEHVAGFFVPPALDERVRGVGEEEGPDGDDQRRHGGAGEADAPSPPAADLRGAVVHQVRHEDADGDHQLEADVERAAVSRWRHLRQPTPTPRRMRPMMSMATSLAAPLMAAPARKVTPPKSIEILRPKTRVTVDAKKEATSAARYREEVNAVRSGLSNLQYWFVDVFIFSFLYTDGKNFSRNESIDVTPPASHCRDQIPEISHTHSGDLGRGRDRTERRTHRRFRYRSRR